jgi:hypothetical protein
MNTRNSRNRSSRGHSHSPENLEEVYQLGYDHGYNDASQDEDYDDDFTEYEDYFDEYDDDDDDEYDNSDDYDDDDYDYDDEDYDDQRGRSGGRGSRGGNGNQQRDSQGRFTSEEAVQEVIPVAPVGVRVLVPDPAAETGHQEMVPQEEVLLL